MTRVAQLLQAIAGFGLTDAAVGSMSMSPTRHEWVELQAHLVRERLTGMAAMLAGKGVLRLDQESKNELAEIDGVSARHTLRAEDVLLAFVRDLDDAEVPFRVLKGVALAELTWRWGEARRWVDADVLVPGDRLDEVVALCRAKGATRPVPELRPGFDRRFAKSVTLKSADGPEIDLHRTVALGPHAFLVPQADLWDRPRRFSAEGVGLAAMSPEATLIHLCVHATVAGHQRAASVRDVVETFNAGDLDADIAAAMAGRWRARPMVNSVADAVEARLGIDDHPFLVWARAQSPDPEETRIAAVYDPQNRTGVGLARASLRHVPGLVDKLRYATAFAWPSPANRTRRGRSLNDQIRRLGRR